ncbi:hypothetical protein NQ318_008262 [Aromia moschata]|uniref:Uncharacterized protein n=1 Tax=Aromia moschata TaxID=1265417 RepID=A0AAV8Y8M0_9CUCU|nr:hypothetical protein NQ318_008262 [Aromia moschata]
MHTKSRGRCCTMDSSAKVNIFKACNNKLYFVGRFTSPAASELLPLGFQESLSKRQCLAAKLVPKLVTDRPTEERPCYAT